MECPLEGGQYGHGFAVIEDIRSQLVAKHASDNPVANKNVGAGCEIEVDRTPRTDRDVEKLAFEAPTSLALNVLSSAGTILIGC